MGRLPRLLMAGSFALPFLFTVSTSRAATYDAVTQFSSLTNTTSNIWQYGTSTGPESGFSLLTMAGFSVSPSYNLWSADGRLFGPVVAFNGSGGTITIPAGPVDIIWPDDVLGIGPGSTVYGKTNFATIRFVAPTDGTFNVTGAFSDLEEASVNVYVYANGVKEFSGSFSGTSYHQGSLPFALTAITLTKGELVDLTVDSLGEQSNDFVGLSATVTSNAVPEPSSFFLALLAIGCAALFAPPRRKPPQYSTRQ